MPVDGEGRERIQSTLVFNTMPIPNTSTNQPEASVSFPIGAGSSKVASRLSGASDIMSSVGINASIGSADFEAMIAGTP